MVVVPRSSVMMSLLFVGVCSGSTLRRGGEPIDYLAILP
jgi:hypothetical protein